MSKFFGVTRHVFNMSIRRKGLWIAYLLLFVFYGIVLFTPSPEGDVLVIPADEAWPFAGELVFMFNMLMPLVAGILSADRVQRDFELNLRELQRSTPLKNSTYILGAYFGVLFSVLLPIFVWVTFLGILAVPLAQAPPVFPLIVFLAFLAINIPASAFVVAFSLVIPLVMPIRVYQILFTGYWFWGNYLNPDVFPTLSGTLLTPGGRYALEAFFGTFNYTNGSRYSKPEAWLNLLVLSTCVVLVLFSLDRYLAWQAAKA